MFIAPHNKVARDVTEKDLKKVFEVGQGMHEACRKPHGVHTGGMAIAHPQVESEDPMRFFVTRDGDCIINPVITRHTKYKRIKPEGCLSFPMWREAGVERFYKIEVTFQTFDEVQLMASKYVVRERTAKLKGFEAQVWQHEIDHLDGINVWKEYGEEHTLDHFMKKATGQGKEKPKKKVCKKKVQKAEKK